MKKVLIIEDNPYNLESLCKIVKDIKEDVTLYASRDVATAYKDAMEHRVDLFLIDIILDTTKPGDVSGMVFAEGMRGISRYEFTPMIFITSLEDPRLHAYENLHCYGYIVKPFNLDDTIKIITKALRFPSPREEDKFVYFRKDGVLYAKQIKQIVYIENSNRRMVIHATDEKLTIPYKTCTQILSDLDSDRFLQCSRHAIVNREFIHSVDKGNRYVVLKQSFGRIELGVSMQKRFMDDFMQ